jgi:nucleoside-diphosphate-sugar epimerase
VGVLGATSFVGQAVLERLQESGAADGDRPVAPVWAFSRNCMPAVARRISAGTRWHQLPIAPGSWHASIPHWIAVCPLWAVSEHFPLLEAAEARRLVAISSTSRSTKRDSPAASERALAARLAAAEERVLEWAAVRGIRATILRPTMIYDGIHDQNVARIARFIHRFGFYPVAGAANGLRQPVHRDDIAAACHAALAQDRLLDSYDISGGETLTYRDMVRRIFASLNRTPRLITVPMPLVKAAAALIGHMPPLESLPTMAIRMNEDLVFDHGAASRDFGFQPRVFSLPSEPDWKHA